MDKQAQTGALSSADNQISSSNSRLTNWAGNLTYSTSKVHQPATVEEVQSMIRQCSKLRVIGSRHSFNTIADSPAHLMTLEAMKRVVELDVTNHSITVESGTRYGDVALYLEENGYALPNLASLPHITIVGACATATHGSGVKNRSLASAVSAIEFVDGRGEVVTLSKNKNAYEFKGAVVSLGALGVVTKLTLDLLPTFQVKQAVYLDLPMEELKHCFDDIQQEGYSVSLFTDWQNKNIGEVWVKRIADAENNIAARIEMWGAKPATDHVHPISGESAENVTEQLEIPGAWYERLPHFKMGFKPSAGTELQSEYFVPIEHAYEAITAIEKLHQKLSSHLYISEIRTIAADDYWLSPFYQRPSVAFHFTWKQQTAAVMKLLPLIEEALAPFSPRPHWGKVFTLSAKSVQAQYARLVDFRQLAQHYDPTGKFRNGFLDAYLFSEVGLV